VPQEEIIVESSSSSSAASFPAPQSDGDHDAARPHLNIEHEAHQEVC